MSMLSKGLRKLGRGAKKLVTHPREALGNIGKDLGKGWEAVDDYALPAAGFMLAGPGGAAAGAAAARGIGDGRFDPGATLTAGARGYALGQAGQMAGLGGGGSGIRALGGGGAANAATAAPNAGFSWGGAARNAGQWALDNPELLAGALSTAGGLDAQRKAGRNERKMMELIEREYAERAPLRQLGLRNLTREMEPLDLSVFRNSQNPFSG